MLRERLKPYFDKLEPHEKPQAIRAVGHLILVGDYMAYRNLIRDLSPCAYGLFYKEVRNFVKASFECRKLWRTVLSTVKNPKKLKLTEEASRFGADPKDVAFFWEYLTAEDKEAIKKAALQEDDYGFLSSDDFKTLVKTLERYCGKVSYLKLRFLSDNDRALDLADLKAELLAHAIQVVRLYEHCGDLKKIENYAKRGVTNHAVNLIQFHTSESRARITNNTKGCGTCIFCLTEKPQKCKYAVADYRNTTLSLQVLSPTLDALPQPSLRSAPTADKKLQRDSFVSFMTEGMPDSAVSVIDLVINSDPDEEFEEWLLAVHRVTVDALLTNPRRLVRLLCEYLHVSHKDVTRTIRERYTAYRNSI